MDDRRRFLGPIAPLALAAATSARAAAKLEPGARLRAFDLAFANG